MTPHIQVVDAFALAPDGSVLARSSRYDYYSRESDEPYGRLTRVAGSGRPIDGSTGQPILVPGGDDDHSLWDHSDAFFGAAPVLLGTLRAVTSAEADEALPLWIERICTFETVPVDGLTRPDRPRLDEVQLRLTFGASPDAQRQTSLNIWLRSDGTPKFVSSFEGGMDSVGMRLASPWMNAIEADWNRIAPLFESPVWIDPEPWQ